MLTIELVCHVCPNCHHCAEATSGHYDGKNLVPCSSDRYFKYDGGHGQGSSTYFHEFYTQSFRNYVHNKIQVELPAKLKEVSDLAKQAVSNQKLFEDCYSHIIELLENLSIKIKAFLLSENLPSPSSTPQVQDIEISQLYPKPIHLNDIDDQSTLRKKIVELVSEGKWEEAKSLSINGHPEPQNSVSKLTREQEQQLRSIIRKKYNFNSNEISSLESEVTASFWGEYFKFIGNDILTAVGYPKKSFKEQEKEYRQEFKDTINFLNAPYQTTKAYLVKEYVAMKTSVIDALDLASDPKTRPKVEARIAATITEFALARKIGMFAKSSKAGDLHTTNQTRAGRGKKRKDNLDHPKTPAEIVEEAARSESAKGANYLKQFMSDKEWDAYISNPAKGSRFLGQAVHKATNDTLKGLYGPERFKYSTIGPDFYDNLTGQLVELTTPGAKAAHVAKYAERFPDLEIVTYELPKP